ncbi:MAG: 2OG-Fe(II) oxygenase [Pseudomonadota bacterium]|jgi:uncharacterized protein
MSEIDWLTVLSDLDLRGWAVIKALLPAAQCRRVAAMFTAENIFRSHVHMARHAFGSGEYKYFSYPLPELIAQLRNDLYPPLSEIANRWNAMLGIVERFPATHANYLRQCHAAGQTRPTPLLLRYGPGDYNRLHQDLYGDMVFPLQLTLLLSQPQNDFTGGEFVMTESRARMQTRPYVAPLGQGDAVVFAVNLRPVRSVHGYGRITMRHGVSALHSGQRFALGIIFHDAT